MRGWLPFDGWVWDFANGDDSRLDMDDPLVGVDTYWPKEREDDSDFDWPTKAVKYLRVEIYLHKKKGEVFKQITVLLG